MINLAMANRNNKLVFGDGLASILGQFFTFEPFLKVSQAPTQESIINDNGRCSIPYSQLHT
jgi:hypothetical protein